MCYGTFKNDVFCEGFVTKFNKDDGKMKDLIAYKKEENQNPKGEKIKIEKNVEKIMTKIRNLFFSKNYFKDIYQEFKNILRFREEKMKDINMIINNDKYEEIIKVLESDNITLYRNIEKIIEIK